ncbi:MAG TPA: hypothetical protein VN328_03775 [Thermodesulfovibrionales bacterium]|nr:hypothetical protein [Thermodesulfovibrionales bacterium]
MPFSKKLQSAAAALSAIAVLAILGCSTANISRERGLSANEGILITRIHTNMENLQVVIHAKDAIGLPIAMWQDKSLEYLKVIPIESGEARFSMINRYVGMMRYRVRPEPAYFKIKPGIVTYVGDVFIQWDAPPNSLVAGDAQVRIVDNEEATLKEVREKFPWIFEKLPYSKDVPVAKIDTVKGFEEVEELKSLKERRQEQRNKDGEK